MGCTLVGRGRGVAGAPVWHPGSMTLMISTSPFQPKPFSGPTLCAYHKNSTGRYSEKYHRASYSTNHGSYCKGTDIKVTRVLEQNCTTDYEVINTEVIKS